MDCARHNRLNLPVSVSIGLTLLILLVFGLFVDNAPASTVHASGNALVQSITQPKTQFYLWQDNPPPLRTFVNNPTPLNWSPPSRKTINQGFSLATIWIRIPVFVPENSSLAEDFILYLDYPLLDEIEFVYRSHNSNQIANYYFTGDLVPFATRPIKHRAFAFPFSLNPGEEGTIYIRANATDTLQFPLKIYTAEAFDYQRSREQYVLGIYYGGLTVMIFFMGLLYFILRDKSLLLFTSFTLCVIVLTASLNGDMLHLFPNFNVHLNKWLRVFALLFGAVAMGAFTREFLSTREYLPRLDNIIKRIIQASLLVFLILTALPFYNAIQLALAWCATLATFALVIGSSSFIINYPPAKFFMIGWVVFLFGGLANVFRAFSIVPTNLLTEYGVQFGALFNVITITLGIAHRFTIERRRVFQLEQSAQEERHKKEQAQAEVRAKSQFLANMSHEIRTPMNGVLGITNLLKDTPLNSQQEQYVKTIENSGNALLTIINDILDFSKIEAGKMTIEKIEFNIDELVSEASSLFASVADEKGLNFYVACRSAIPAIIYSDPIRIRQVLLNLLSNAFKFTQTGTVGIEYEIIASNNESKIKFAIIDTGIGLTAEQQESLFQSFVQADTSTTRQFGGTGLGLSISQRLCELLGGEISVSSKPEKGSTFWFSVKTNLNEMPPNSIIQFKRSHLDLFRGKQILIADQHAKTLNSLQLRFSQWQCDCSTFTANELLLDNYEPQANNLAVILDYDRLHASPKLLNTTLEQLSQEQIPIIFSASSMIKPNYDVARHQQQIRIIEKPLTFYRVYRTIEECLLDKQEKEKSNQQHKQLTDLSLIVAEDNKVNQMVIKGMLKRLGITPILCENGQSCLEAIQNNSHIDCIIMDCEMPVMDGYDATTSIRKMRDITQPKIVGLSANALKEHEEKALAHGMDKYLRKPVDYEQLKAVLLGYFH